MISGGFPMSDLSRFVTAQQRSYSTALSEIRSGRKYSHWMWYIFPQIAGLGFSSTAQFYAISSLQEAKDFLADPYLGANLLEISAALLANPSDDPRYVMGYPDDLKLCSCMTLFREAGPQYPVFQQVLDKFYNGYPDERTLALIR